MEEKYYRHFKGGKYRMIGVARDSEDPARDLVVYQALYGEKGLWVRPKMVNNVEIGGMAGLSAERLSRTFIRLISTMSTTNSILSMTNYPLGLSDSIYPSRREQIMSEILLKNR